MSQSVLIINDDGPESPLLAPFLTSVAKSSFATTLTAILPQEEKSWISQAMSLSREVLVRSTEIAGIDTFLIDGTPADCAAIGIENLLPQKPDYVLSGINMGINAGIHFYHNSGTIGAARQAYAHQTAAVAFSLQVPKEIFHAWIAKDAQLLAQHETHWHHAADLATNIAQALIAAHAWNYANVFSVNIPWELNTDSTVVLTRLESQHYQALFEEKHNGSATAQCFVRKRQFGQIVSIENQCFPEALPGDMSNVLAGNISITPLCYTPEHQQKTAAEALQTHFTSFRLSPL